MSLRVVALSGSLRSPSTTRALLDAVVAAVAVHRPVDARAVELHALADDLAAAVTGRGRSAALEAALAEVAAADLVIAGTPIYRGSYTGLFKLFIDAVPQDALGGTPVLLTAGGGSDQHVLAIDHELRPLFAFFGALTLPLGVYARPGDFTPERAVDAGGPLPDSIERAVAAALPFLRDA